MLIATVDYLPDKKYEVLGVVSGNRAISIFSKTEALKAIEKMKSDAIAMGGNAIIGIRINTTSNNTTNVIGTVIRIIE